MCESEQTITVINQLDIPIEFVCTLCETAFSTEDLCNEHMMKCRKNTYSSVSPNRAHKRKESRDLVDHTGEVPHGKRQKIVMNYIEDKESVTLEDPCNFSEMSSVKETFHTLTHMMSSENDDEEVDLSFIQNLDLHSNLSNDSEPFDIEYLPHTSRDEKLSKIASKPENENNNGSLVKTVSVFSVNKLKDPLTKANINLNSTNNSNNIKTLTVLSNVSGPSFKNHCENDPLEIHEIDCHKTDENSATKPSSRNITTSITTKPKKKKAEREVVNTKNLRWKVMSKKNYSMQQLYPKFEPEAEEKKSDKYSVFEFYDEFDEIKKLQEAKEKAMMKELKSKTCHICKEVFEDPMDVLRHRRAQHATKKILLPRARVQPYLNLRNQSHCPLCGKLVSSKGHTSTYVKHMLSHCHSSFSCSICEQKFKRLDHLKTHEKRHIVLEKS